MHEIVKKVLKESFKKEDLLDVEDIMVALIDKLSSGELEFQDAAVKQQIENVFNKLE